ncbi:type I CRISPR-associated protein Cas7 [Paenibacillus doosanensis]|uniref:type I CRISPR-associated protein Cas7 n=1 Tax=Paenibacillus doosanensis TaxID=1229154 RepID=UPI00217FC091|nr:type I CRISPR-associated protein Cas7 [Paenibacillus doosanensis]MCS7464202.1 type I CRISPR-associated protein Cas7 [Paenibacillus doosanensis]
MSEFINRGTGLLLIDVKNSNPNGDPDRESDPRTRHDGRGEISPVSFKRKLRDLVAAKDSPIWVELAQELELSAEGFDILESKDTKRADVRSLSSEELLDKYWDVRVFGTTFLEEKSGDTGSFISTGVVQFGLGVSLDPVKIERMTTTKVLPVEDDKSKGMAPLAFRIVSYAVYAMPFFINATAAQKTRCTKKDIELLLRLIPHAYKETASYIRSQVDIRYAFYVEHNRARGTFNDFKIIEALTPAKINNTTGAATSWNDYNEAALLENIAALNTQLEGKTSPVINLMDRL